MTLAIAFRPVGAKWWRAQLGGVLLRDSRGRVRRFATRDAALKAAAKTADRWQLVYVTVKP